ncbi:MAG: hypothetical protein NZ870_04185, partial [bacterium]|nr:hypothetical protein [bacterium]
SYKIPFYGSKKIDVEGFYPADFSTWLVEIVRKIDAYNVKLAYSVFSGSIYEESIVAAGISNELHTALLEETEKLKFGVALKSMRYLIKYTGFTGITAADIDASITYSVSDLNFFLKIRNILSANIGLYEVYRQKSDFVFSVYYKKRSLTLATEFFNNKPVVAFGLDSRVSIFIGFGEDKINLGTKIDSKVKLGFGGDLYYRGLNGFFLTLEL